MKRRMLAVVVTFLVATVFTCQAETVFNTDFSKGSTGWVLNGTAQLAGGLLQMVNDSNDEVGSAWVEIQRKVPSFSFIADMQFRHDQAANGCPADGAAMAFSSAGTDAIGGGGGYIGLFGGAIPQFTALDINTWFNQGLRAGESCNDTNNLGETLAFDVVNPKVQPAPYDRNGNPDSGSVPRVGGAKIAQAALKPLGITLMNGGRYRFQWNVDQVARTMSVYVTGLEAGKNDQFKKVLVTQATFPDVEPVKNLIDFDGRWGFTAACGGLNQIVEVAAARVEVPAVPPQ